MGSALIALIVVGIVLGLWNDARVSQERAMRAVRLLLRGSGVQLLDGTVSLLNMRMERNARGWLAFSRTYGFDLSRDGVSRESGKLTLTGDKVEVLEIPDFEPEARRGPGA
jgi:hypothetical protein